MAAAKRLVDSLALPPVATYERIDTMGVTGITMPTQLNQHQAQRLEALRRYHVLDAPDQQAFDDVALTVAHAFKTPMAGVTLVDESRFWLKSRIGFDHVAPVPVEASFTKQVTSDSGMLVVQDASKDARFAQHPMVAGEPYLRFYAGAALETPDGWPIGVLWVADLEPREFAGPDQEALKALARQFMALMELGRANAEQAQKLTRVDQEAKEPLLLWELQHRVRNNLQVIESLISLQVGSEPSRAGREALKRVQIRLRPLLLIDRQLETHEPLAEIDLAGFLEDLCRHLIAFRGANGVDLDVSLEPAMMARERAVAIGLIVNEFVTNSFKHAFARRGGRLSLSLARDHDRLTLSLADSGPGLPHRRRKVGLGLRIIPALVEQIEGSLVWQYGPGTRLTVTLDLRSGDKDLGVVAPIALEHVGLGVVTPQPAIANHPHDIHLVERCR